MSVLVKEPHVVETSRAHHGISHNHIAVLGRRALEITVITAQMNFSYSGNG